MSGDEKTSAVVVPLRRRGCLQCGQPVVMRWRPFCSKRCADLDLGRWLTESYRFPTDEEPELDAPLGEHDEK
jgi:uncharacterized protein